MKKILIPLSVRTDPQDPNAPNLHNVRANYVEKCVRYGLLPIFVSPLMTEEMVEELYGQCIGALFLGGPDFDAKYYGEANHPKSEHPANGRDELELSLLNMLFEDRKPVLGICRGCQAMAIASGGSLHQHLPDLGLKEHHGVDLYSQMKSDQRHQVIIDRNSKAFGILRQDIIWSNSGHHQAVKTLGDSLVVAGKTSEGVVELIEHKEPDYFCFGIQSHPEMDETSDLEPFFKAFADAVATAEAR